MQLAITGVSLFQSNKNCVIRKMFFPLSNLPRHSVTEREVSELSHVHIRVLYDCDLFTHHISYRSLRSVRAWLLAKSCKPQIWLMSRSVQSGHDTLLIKDSLTFLGLRAGGCIRTFRHVLF